MLRFNRTRGVEVEVEVDFKTGVLGELRFNRLLCTIILVGNVNRGFSPVVNELRKFFAAVVGELACQQWVASCPVIRITQEEIVIQDDQGGEDIVTL